MTAFTMTVFLKDMMILLKMTIEVYATYRFEERAACAGSNSRSLVYQRDAKMDDLPVKLLASREKFSIRPAPWYQKGLKTGCH